MTAVRKTRSRNTPPRHSLFRHIFVFLGFCASVVVSAFALFYVVQADLFPTIYRAQTNIYVVAPANPLSVATSTEEQKPPKPIRIETPDTVKAIYMTQCVAGTPSFRDKLIALAQETEINTIIIDIKDYSGGLGFIPKSAILKEYISDRCRAPDMEELVRRINEKGIYAIARITVFQDPIYALRHPDQAVQKASDGSVWSDNKGLHFIDVSAIPAWEHIVSISKEAYDIGFDELNFDYIRFPSDGPMSDIAFPYSSSTLAQNRSQGMAIALERFFIYLHNELKDIPVKTSADLFGMVTTNIDDLNIGQQLERALPYFDYIAPMVYPSHFPSGFYGISNPNKHVYDIINISMGRAVDRVSASTTIVHTLAHSKPVSTTTPYRYPKDIYVPKEKLRPWLQDFDYGGNYGVDEVRAQIQATYDAGLDSWMLWDPSNIYTKTALLPHYTTSTPIIFKATTTNTATITPLFINTSTSAN